MEQNRRAASRRRLQEKKHLQSSCLLVLFFAVIILFDLIALFAPDRAFSETENRSLAQRPALTADSLSAGSYGSDLQAYTADQFPARNFWVGLKRRFDLMLGKQELNGVYLGKQDYLIEVPTAVNEAGMEKNISAINAFAAANSQLNCSVCIVPNAVYVLADKLPSNAPGQDQAQMIAQIGQRLENAALIDVTQTLLAHKSEALYYRTDHHWTSLAAKYAFAKLAPELGLQAITDYTVYRVSNSFEGTLCSKSGIYPAKDSIDIYVPSTDVIYNVTYAGASETGKENTVSRTMYVSSCLQDKNQYTVFLGGNYPQVTVDTTAQTGKTLLLFKDSYANCMLQFLYPYYDHILIIDPRYYTGSISSLIRQNDVTDVLFFYNFSTWAADTSLANALLY